MNITDLNCNSRATNDLLCHDDQIQLSEVLIVVGNQETGWSLMSPVEVGKKEFKATSDQPFQNGTAVECAFSTKSRRFICSVGGTVHWCRKVKDDWHVGIILEDTLDDKIQMNSPQDMRSVLRYPVRCPGFIRLRPGGKPIEVTLQDYSLIGCSFTGNIDTRRGAIVELAFDPYKASERWIDLQVRCVSKMPDGQCMIGTVGPGLAIIDAMQNTADSRFRATEISYR